MEGIERWKEEEDENQRHERLNYRPPTFSPVSRYEIRQIEKGNFNYNLSLSLFQRMHLIFCTELNVVESRTALLAEVSLCNCCPGPRGKGEREREGWEELIGAKSATILPPLSPFSFHRSAEPPAPEGEGEKMEWRPPPLLDERRESRLPSFSFSVVERGLSAAASFVLQKPTKGGGEGGECALNPSFSTSRRKKDFPPFSKECRQELGFVMATSTCCSCHRRHGWMLLFT